MDITVQNIYDYIDGFAPFNTQCEWDNSGLLVGNRGQIINKIGVVLDVTPEAVNFAAENNIGLIISHHPVIFKPVRTLLEDNILYPLIKENISVISAHTCLDKAKGGVSDALAKKLGFSAFQAFDSGDASMLRIAEIDETSGEDLAKYVSKKLSAPVNLGDSGNKIKKVALCGGSGADFMKEAVSCGCNAYITGDASHHSQLDFVSHGVTLITAGHFETENPVVSVIAEKLRNKFNLEVLEIPQFSPTKTVFYEE